MWLTCVGNLSCSKVCVRIFQNTLDLNLVRPRDTDSKIVYKAYFLIFFNPRSSHRKLQKKI